METFKQNYPHFKQFFNFQDFNKVQQTCYNPIMNDHRNIVVSAPTSSGKTVIFELAIIKHFTNSPTLKSLYLAPIKSLCHEKVSDWSKKLKGKISVCELTGDTNPDDEQDLDSMELVIATPQKIDSYSRKNLQFLKKINLLLIDEIHMLNFEERGATLEAIVSRIISMSNPRIIAVSATIPNIKEVAQWLKVPSQLMFAFGSECRPVKINKVVLGFKSTNNPYTFERMLNYKLIDIIRNYSYGKGCLVFCQTQKGTQMACQQLVSDMKERQFVEDDECLLALIQGSKRITNSSLQLMLPQGVAFHNASLSLQDRNALEKLFLEGRVRIMCTTSTLAVGINLPARLVVIKSTQCYRGAGKGYQEYSQIQIDQMMGRAGRPPFDKEGTVVIMTQQSNYNKYLKAGQLETLESHLYHQLCEHINAQISIKSLETFPHVLQYFKNSFCYIRMKNSPSYYGIKLKQQLEQHIHQICLQAVNKLNQHSLITFYPENQRIIPRQLGINVSRNTIQINTIISILSNLPLKSERAFLELICNSSSQIQKYRNKLDERKLLKQLNQRNKYTLKSAVSNSQKKCFVLLQAELDGKHIENWEMRKQAKDILYYFTRLMYCVKGACQDKKMFWPFYWSSLFHKFCSSKFWPRNQTMTIRQFPQLNQKWKTLSVKGFKNITHVMNNLHMLDTICQTKGDLSRSIQGKMNCLKNCVKLSCKKEKEKNILIISFISNFIESFKQVIVCMGQKNSQEDLYVVRILKSENKQTTVFTKANKQYYIGIIKEGYIGFDEFYLLDLSGNLQKIQSPQNLHENVGQMDRKSADHVVKKRQNQLKKGNRPHSLQISKKIKNDSKQSFSKLIDNKHARKSLKVQKNNNTNSRQSRKINHEFHQNGLPLENTMKRGTFIPLNQYKCWKPGFPEIQQLNDSRQTLNSRKLMIIQELSSKSKLNGHQNKMKQKQSLSKYNYCQVATSKYSKKNESNKNKFSEQTTFKQKQKQCYEIGNNVYDYFYNLF